MRTTMNLDKDVLFAAKEIARHRGVAIGKVVSDMVREAMTRRPATAMRGDVPLFPVQPGAGVVTLELVNELRDETP